MENFQDEGGTVAVPEVLRPFGAPATIGGNQERPQ
jgi:seryl-tRNA synthetase